METSCPHCGKGITLPRIKPARAWIAAVLALGCVAGLVLIFCLKHRTPPAPLSPLEALQAEAAKGNADAMFRLGQTYLTGKGVPTNLDEGMSWIQKAATAKNAKAMTVMGDSLLQAALQAFQTAHQKDAPDPATGLELDHPTCTNIPPECFDWYRKAAAAGDTNAMWQLVRNLTLGLDYLAANQVNPATSQPWPLPTPEMVRWLRTLADGGDRAAMLQLGAIYIYGDDEETNVTAGINLIKKAGDHGSDDAWLFLGALYETGNGVAKDVFQAVAYYEKAAARNNIDAEMNLAHIYSTDSLLKDPATALNWYQQVANQPMLRLVPGELDYYRRQVDVDEACLQVAKAYDNGWGVPVNKQMAGIWYAKAANDDDTEAQWHMGVMSDLGEGMPEDKRAAFQWYYKAASHPGSRAGTLPGVAESQRNLGYLYQMGEGVSKDPEVAFNWFFKAATNGSVGAEFEVAQAYGSGLGVLQDKAEAFDWYQRAANDGSKKAQIKLAVFYLQQVGTHGNTPENRMAAYVWLELAGAQGYEDAPRLRTGLVQKMQAKEVAEAQAQAKAFSTGSLQITNPVPVLGESAFETPITETDMSSAPAPGLPEFEVLEATAKPTEENDLWWRYGYRITVRNNGKNNAGQWFHVQFLDAQGYVIDTALTQRTVIWPGSAEVITGEILINLPGAARVAAVKATWN